MGLGSASVDFGFIRRGLHLLGREVTFEVHFLVLVAHSACDVKEIGDFLSADLEVVLVGTHRDPTGPLC